MSLHVVTMAVPSGEQLDPEHEDGYWRVTPLTRLRETRALARAMQVTWLPPYVPRFARTQGRPGVWDTAVNGYLRATPVRALRWHFNDSARLAADCTSCRVLALAAAFKSAHSAVQWADMGEIGAWPMALRLDARRLADRFAALAIALWCPSCDDAPAASRGMFCLWCERQAPAPPGLALQRRAA